jgi:membrane associated rhomboid family serine protease
MPESVKRRGSSGPTIGAMLGLWSGVVAIDKEGYGRALQLLLALVLLMWGLEVVDTALDHRLDQYGIEPREVDGLDGIVAAPFLHVGFGHLAANTVPFAAMGLVIAFEGALRLLGVTAITAVISGLGTWLIAPDDTIHLGASGVVFGYATYLIARGWFNRRVVEIAIGVAVAVLWGGALLAGLEPQQGISWQGHLFGAIGGVVAARMLSERGPAAGQPGRSI